MKKILLSFALLGTMALPALAQTPAPAPTPTPTTPAPAPTTTPAAAPATTTAPAPPPPAPASEGGVRLGISFSPNNAWLNTDSKDIESDGTRLGYSFGIVAEFPFGPRGAYAFRTGLGMSSIGGKFKADYTAADSAKVSTSQELMLNYLQLPVLLKLGTKTGKAMDFYGLVGGNVGFNIRARGDYSTTTTQGSVVSSVSDENVDIMDEVSLLNIGMLVGVGAEFHLGDASLFAGINYNKGLTNVLDKDAKTIVDPDDKSKLRADYLELNLGVFF